jgi:hypothetical protein
VRVLRLLLAPGDGNRLLFRLAQALDHPLSDVVATPGVAPLPQASEPLIFGLGAMPATGVPASPDTTRRALIPINKLMSRKVLVINGSIATADPSACCSYSWAQLIGLVANKLGSVHADDQVPVAFDEVYRFGLVDGIHPIAFAVRALAVETSRVGATLLTATGYDVKIVPRSLLVGPNEIWIGELHWYGHFGGMVHVFLNAVSRVGKPPEVKWTRERDTLAWP